MTSPADALRSLWPALAFLLAAVPMAGLLDQLGFFDASASVVAARSTSMLGLWVLAALTTVVLNLDTTIVLLTPLYFRLARRAGVDPVPVVAVPLLLAGLASSVLPVSNLTTLIAAEAWHLGVGDVVIHLAPASLVATTVGWFCYRGRYSTHLPPAPTTSPDRRALTIGGGIVAGVLIGFTLGPTVGLPAWLVAVLADLVLIGLTRRAPWRQVPVLTAGAIALLAVVVAVVAPQHWLDGLLGHDSPAALLGLAASATVVANALNNLPALLLATDRGAAFGWGAWAWLLGVNVGAVLLPLGAIANLLWWRIVRSEGVTMDLKRYAAVTVPVAGPALVPAAFTLVVQRAVGG